MLAFKVWLLNLSKTSEMDGTPFGLYTDDMFPDSVKNYDYYEVFGNNPEHHMFYSTKYLAETSVFKLLWKHYQFQSMFRRMKVKEEW